MTAPSLTLHRANLIRAAIPVMALTAWTLFVWVGRIRNILSADDLTGWSLFFRATTAVGFTLFGLALTGALVWYVYTRHPMALPLVTWLSAPLAMIGIVFWAARGTAIALGDYDIGFKAVHSVLALVTITLGLWVLRWLRHEPTLVEQ